MIRSLIGFIFAVVTATVAGSILHTQVKLGMLRSAGADIPMDVRLSDTLGDLIGLQPLYGAVIAIGLFIAFLVAWLVRKVLPAPRWFAYGLAGAVALGAAMMLMAMQFEITPIGGARGTLGFALQMAAGALGGLVFSRVIAKDD